MGQQATRPIDHEVTLATPHIVVPGEIESAERSLAEWNRIADGHELDSPEWYRSIRVVATIEGWIDVAREFGETRRSFARALTVCIERVQAVPA